jgi:hypothetical protein
MVPSALTSFQNAEMSAVAVSPWGAVTCFFLQMSWNASFFSIR